jgi:hypothetical protein
MAVPWTSGGATLAAAAIFTALDNWVDLNLIQTRTFPNGVLLTRYETRC